MSETPQFTINWRSRRVGIGKERAADLCPHPDNPRYHSWQQRSYTAQLLDELGQIKPILINKNNGYIVDGHDRAWLALEQGEDTEVDVDYLDLTEAEHGFAMAFLDRTGEYAQYDKSKIQPLLQAFDLSPDNPLFEVATDLEVIAVDINIPLIDFGVTTGNDTPPVRKADVPNAVFPSDNDYGIPTLDIALQADYADMPFLRWGAVRRNMPISGSYHFYTEDYKFEALWHDPSAVINSRCINIIEPNFSTAQAQPKIVALWNIYRKRWLARYWQTHGIRVFVDMNVDGMFMDIALIGVPQGWNAYAIRAYDDTEHLVLHAFELAQQHSGNKAPLFICYAGGMKYQKLAQQHGWIWLPEDAQVKAGLHGTQ